MDYYGYERITPGKAKMTPHALTAARERSEANRKRAWDDLERNDPRDFQLRKFRSNYLAMLRDCAPGRRKAPGALVDPASILPQELLRGALASDKELRPAADNGARDIPLHYYEYRMQKPPKKEAL